MHAQSIYRELVDTCAAAVQLNRLTTQIAAVCSYYLCTTIATNLQLAELRERMRGYSPACRHACTTLRAFFFLLIIAYVAGRKYAQYVAVGSLENFTAIIIHKLTH